VASPVAVGTAGWSLHRRASHQGRGLTPTGSCAADSAAGKMRRRRRSLRLCTRCSGICRENNELTNITNVCRCLSLTGSPVLKGERCCSTTWAFRAGRTAFEASQSARPRIHLFAPVCTGGESTAHHGEVRSQSRLRRAVTREKTETELGSQWLMARVACSSSPWSRRDRRQAARRQRCAVADSANLSHQSIQKERHFGGQRGRCLQRSRADRNEQEVQGCALHGPSAMSTLSATG
jgi:hypothetical protein